MEKKIDVSYDCYKSVLSENEDLRNELNSLKKEFEEQKADYTMDKARVVYAYHILNAGRDEHVLMHMDDKAREVVFWKMKYDKVYMEMQHYKQLSEAVETKYNREKTELQNEIKVLDKQNDNFYCQVEQYKKSNKAWQEKYEKLFEKNKITLNAIEELEKHIDQCLDCRRGIKRCCK